MYMSKKGYIINNDHAISFILKTESKKKKIDRAKKLEFVNQTCLKWEGV